MVSIGILAGFAIGFAFVGYERIKESRAAKRRKKLCG